MNFGPQTASIWKWVFNHPPWILHSTSLPYFARGDQQTELNQTLPDGRWLVALTICRRKVGIVHPEKIGGKNLYIRRFQHLMANICWAKRDIDNRARALESTKDLLRCPKISWTLVHKRLQIGSEFSPTLTILFCLSPSHTLYPALTSRSGAPLRR